MKQDIQTWIGAKMMARNPDRPRRDILYNLYEDVDQDGQVTATMGRRFEVIKGRQFAIYHNSEIDQDRTDLLDRTWFEKYIQYSLESHVYGHSLIQLGDLADGEISGVKLVKRPHVIPTKGTFVREVSDEKGIQYRDDPAYYRFLLEVGDDDNLGLMNKVIPYALFSRFALRAWSEHIELYGKPWRVGKVESTDTKAVNKMFEMLESMGGSAFAVIDKEEMVEFIESQKTSGDIFQGMVDYCNAFISKLFLGAVTGEASQGGSRAKEQVGADINSIFEDADGRFIQRLTNENLLPKLTELGYPFADCKFKFVQEPDLTKLWAIVKDLLPYYDVPEEWITETTGIPVTRKSEPEQPEESKEEEKEKDEDEETLNLDADFF